MPAPLIWLFVDGIFVFVLCRFRRVDRYDQFERRGMPESSGGGGGGGNYTYRQTQKYDFVNNNNSGKYGFGPKRDFGGPKNYPPNDEHKTFHGKFQGNLGRYEFFKRNATLKCYFLFSKTKFL